MANRTLMLEQLASVFEEEQAQVLAAVIYDSYNELDCDLKVIVREIAETTTRLFQRIQRFRSENGRDATTYGCNETAN